MAREFGLAPVSVPGRFVYAAARAATAPSGVPFTPPGAFWIEAASHPAIVDTGKARQQLGWHPRFTGIEALRAAVGNGSRPRSGA